MPNQWTCNNGDCINASDKCDGVKKDCSDGSDEGLETCGKI